MNIGKALKKAKKEGIGIARKNDFPTPAFYILPTNTTERLLLVKTNTGEVIPRWEPSFDDLVKNKWVVYG